MPQVTGAPPGKFGMPIWLDDVVVEGQIGADGIEEPGVSETRLVDDVGRDDARVGAHVLFVVGDDLRAVQRETLVAWFSSPQL